ncbi:hypothetical protein ACWDBD_21540 [Streptomyces sp. NPDC001118]
MAEEVVQHVVAASFARACGDDLVGAANAEVADPAASDLVSPSGCASPPTGGLCQIGVGRQDAGTAVVVAVQGDVDAQVASG